MGCLVEDIMVKVSVEEIQRLQTLLYDIRMENQSASNNDERGRYVAPYTLLLADELEKLIPELLINKKQMPEKINW